jgi:hypothetical protein
MQIILLYVAEKWLALSLPACILLVYVVQKAYLRTSRQLRFLELESRAGVFSNFLETVRIPNFVIALVINPDFTRLRVSKQYGHSAGPKQ